MGPNGLAVVGWTVASSITLASVMCCHRLALGEAVLGSWMRLMCAWTAAALNWEPSWKVTPWRKWNVHTVPSGEVSHFSARSGTIWRSGPNVTRLLKIVKLASYAAGEVCG